jgi:amino acid transporter
VKTLREWIFGKARDLRDPKVFHHVSLIAFFAWVGLGADGLSSSSYGPEEAFKHLVDDRGVPHYHLAVFMALAIALTVFIIAYAYSRIIEQFPHGGGGYLVATKLLSPHAGVVSGCALVVDYVLTISISTAAGANAVFSFLPAEAQQWKFPAVLGVVALLTLMNRRGVKESVQVLTPIFLTFLVTHAVVLVGAVVPNLGRLGQMSGEVREGLGRDTSTLGWLALVLLFARAYSLGGGTFTGIEAVADGVGIMREPRVETGKRTMRYMAASLAITAGGILLAYLLMGVHPSPHDAADPRYQPMNALLTKRLIAEWGLDGTSVGDTFLVLTLLSEGALLLVAAQAGFMDGPRVMANMAVDSWMPHSFSTLSERLTMRNGIYVMGIAAAGTLLYTRARVDTLIVMYSINVFLTFSISQLGMARFWVRSRAADPDWKRHIVIHLVGLALCGTILVVTVLEKFTEGGWVTLLVTALFVALCYGVRSHYASVAHKIKKLDEDVDPLAREVPERAQDGPPPEMDALKPTAVMLVGGYGGLGLRTFLQVDRLFPGQFQQVIFVSVGVIDSGVFKGAAELEALKQSVTSQLERYVEFARKRLGWAADFDMVIGTEAVSELDRLCREVNLRFPRSVFFAGNLIFRHPTWWQRLLHNETAHAIQRRLEFDGFPTVILPVRMLS